LLSKAKYYILGGVLLGFLFGTLLKCNDTKVETITKIKTETIVKTVRDTTELRIVDTVLVKPEKVIIRVPVKVKDTTGVVVVDSIPVQTNKYTGSEELENGTIDYEIFADNLVATKFLLTTQDSTKIITKETLKKIHASRLFLTGGANYGISTKNIEGASLGLTYIRRNEWGIGIYAEQNFNNLLPNNQKTSVGVRLFIGL